MLEPTSHPIYEALNKPMLILGVDRRIFALGLFLGLICYWLLHGIKGLLVGFGLGAACWLVGKVGVASDPQFFTVALLTMKLRKEYEAGRRS